MSEPSDQTPTPTDDPARAGSSIDTVLGKIVVERRLLSQTELDDCNEAILTRAQSSAPTTLADLLVERDFVTRKQLDRLRGDADTAKTSSQLPGYEIIRQIGKGAMGKVYLGRQLSLNRLVAIKEMKKLDASQNAVQRFLREARIGAKLSHNNIVQFVEQLQVDERLYLIMEFVDGDTVKDRIDSRKPHPMGEDECLQIILQMAQALDHAHGRNILHRDIKPANIMMTKAGVAKLADLGLARDMKEDAELARQEAGKAYGTPWYISPEQIRGREDLGPPTDIYGLGATFYHMATGKVPFDGTTQTDVFHAHLNGRLVQPDQRNDKLSEQSALIIETMLQRDLLKRYPNARDLIEDLEVCIANRKRPAGSHSVPLPHAKPEIDLSRIATGTFGGNGGESVQVVRKEAEGPFSNPLVMTIMVLLGLSIAANLGALLAWLL